MGIASPRRTGGDSMPWGVHSEYSEDEGPEVDIDEDQEAVERGEAGTEKTEEFDIDDAIANLD